MTGLPTLISLITNPQSAWQASSIIDSRTSRTPTMQTYAGEPNQMGIFEAAQPGTLASFEGSSTPEKRLQAASSSSCRSVSRADGFGVRSFMW